MRILLTNDDGLRAPGIAALHDALVDTPREHGGRVALPGHDRAKTDVFVVAPLTVQSATGHGVTFHQPLMTREEHLLGASPESPRGVAVDGRPADCVKLALSQIWPDKYGAGSRPDLVVSGMNAGANVGINVIYSGTVAAALEAAFLGVPSIAVSLHIGSSRPRFDIAARYARRAIDAVLAHGPLPAHTCLSINVPITEREWDLPGNWPPIRVCPMNTHGLVDKYERRVSPMGDVYYWSAGHGLDFHATGEGTDVDWIFRKAITITPLMYDLTRADALESWRSRLEGR